MVYGAGTWDKNSGQGTGTWGQQGEKQGTGKACIVEDNEMLITSATLFSMAMVVDPGEPGQEERILQVFLAVFLS
jgi:hypothetical protein